MATTTKLIAVFGATGQQGGPVARALLQKGYQVRAITRNTESDKAKALQAAGAQLHTADLDDAASVESALQGAYGAFLVTDFWGLFKENPDTAYEREIQQGKTTADIAKKVGLKHLVFSTLPFIEPVLRKRIPHMDTKAIVEEYIKEIGVPNTFVCYPFYNENFVAALPPQKQEDGTYTITLPMDGPMHVISVEDVGPIVAHIFDKPAHSIGKKVHLSAEKLTIGEIAAILSEFSGKTVKYNQLPLDVFAQLPFPAAEHYAASFEYFSSGKHEGDIELTRKLNPNTQTFRAWAEKNQANLVWD